VAQKKGGVFGHLEGGKKTEKRSKEKSPASPLRRNLTEKVGGATLRRGWPKQEMKNGAGGCLFVFWKGGKPRLCGRGKISTLRLRKERRKDTAGLTRGGGRPAASVLLKGRPGGAQRSRRKMSRTAEAFFRRERRKETTACSPVGNQNEEDRKR